MRERWDHQRLLAEQGLLDMAWLDPGSVNFIELDAEGLPIDSPFVYINSNSDIRWILQQCSELKLGPAIAIFDTSFLRIVHAIERAGRMPPGALVKLYFGGDGGDNTFGMPPTEDCLNALVSMMSGSRLPWSVAAMFGDCIGSGVAEAAIRLGGHIRVGVEDYRGASQPTNAELVTEAASLARANGRPVATCAEAAQLLGLPRRVSVHSA
jgi:uncharacterized protein (DUF849 family)